VFDAARTGNANLVVMGWGDQRPWSVGRAERPLRELARDLPCDFLVLKDRGFDPERVLVPTAGGPDSDLSAEIAAILRDELDADVTLMHVIENEEQRAEGERFLGEWADGHALGDARQVWTPPATSRTPSPSARPRRRWSSSARQSGASSDGW
jgi:hypothetical protein